jgi:hypothetical protein
MKTIRVIALAIFALIVLNACTVEENPEKWYSEVITVNVDEWGEPVRFGNDAGYHYEYIYDGLPPVEGIVNVYMFVDYGTSDEIQLPLPYTDYKVEWIDNGNPIYYSIQYSYDITKDGIIAFKIYVSDYLIDLIDLYTEHFRVTIIY